jgi:succinate dehydrogenase/fumarate reductase iron-sulfur protein
MDDSVVFVMRFNPGTDVTPVFQEYVIPYDPQKTVLDALQYIYEHVDRSLAFRGACQSGFCGVCGVNLNGRPCLACATYMSRKMRIEPLSGHKVIRDLVVDFNRKKR